jgi:uncharacterized membrane protein YqhA
MQHHAAGSFPAAALQNSDTERRMKRFLAACRYILIVPVIGCLSLTVALVLMGMGRVFAAVADLVRGGNFSSKAAKTLSLAAIEIIDLFLVGTVAYIAAIGLYKLFISNVEIALPMRLKINSLKDLEYTLCGVLVVAMGVAFLGQAIGSTESASLLSYGAGIALVIVALALFVFFGEKGGVADDETGK